MSSNNDPKFTPTNTTGSSTPSPVVSAGAVKPLPLHFHFLAGGIAGMTEIIAMYPLDVVKTRFQLQVGSNVQYTGILDCLVKMVKQEGFANLYRGVTAPILIEAPKRAIKFAAFENYKPYYLDLFNTRVTDFKVTLATGISAGITEAVVVVPFDLVKIRMQDKANKALYLNTTDCVKKIVKAEGPLALFNGLEATCFRHGTWTGTYFATIYGWKKNSPLPTQTKNEIMFNNFVAGAVGGTLGTILNTPFDVVKTRIQNYKGEGIRKYNWTIPSTLLVAREEGIKALYKGFTPKVLRLGPGGGILLVVFDVVSNYLRKFL